jgi:hypothetical protein
MLFGLVRGVMQKRNRYRRDDPVGWSGKIERVTTDLWRHMTGGQRVSSLNKRVISPSSGTKWQWVYTLAGKKSGTSPLDRAYEVVYETAIAIPAATVVGGATDRPLPAAPPNITERECDMCPVASRCAARIR